MDLLKKGVKTLSQRLNTSMELNPVDVPPSRISSSYKPKHERHSKQMTLNSKLELLAADKVVKVSYPFSNSSEYLFKKIKFIGINNVTLSDFVPMLCKSEYGTKFFFLNTKLILFSFYLYYARMPNQNMIFVNAIE